MILHRDLKPENGKRRLAECEWNSIDRFSLPGRQPPSQAWRLWLIQSNAVARLCVDIRRDSLLYVA